MMVLVSYFFLLIFRIFWPHNKPISQNVWLICGRYLHTLSVIAIESRSSGLTLAIIVFTRPATAEYGVVSASTICRNMPMHKNRHRANSNRFARNCFEILNKNDIEHFGF